MTNDERDKLIQETHDAMVVMKDKIVEHHTTLYGNGKPGLKEDMAIQKINYQNCPARKAATQEGKGLTIAYVMMVIAIISLVVTAVSNFIP